jgi:MYXO-CTERM domain-containing protein
MDGRKSRRGIAALGLVVVAALAPIGSAHAGGTTTDTGGSSTDTGGTSTDTREDGTSSGNDSFDEGSCGSCSGSSDGLVSITAPADGATVVSPFTVDIRATPDCSCDDCGCYDDSPHDISVRVDGSPYGAPCDGAQCSFELDLLPGEYEITAVASFDFHENSTSVQIVVMDDDNGGTLDGVDDYPDDTADPTDADPDASGSSTGPEADEDASEGCGCRADGVPTAGGTMALALVGMLFRRRGRRR